MPKQVENKYRKANSYTNTQKQKTHIQKTQKHDKHKLSHT